MKKKIIIIGGLSAGPSAAAKARREDESAEITLFEKTAHISYATCGIPYALSGKIKDREKLMVVKPSLLIQRFNIDVKLEEAVLKIDTAAQLVITEKGTYPYDQLIYATGGTAIIPPIDGLADFEEWSTCKTIQDFDKITQDNALENKQSIAIIGAGLIGLEAAENLVKAGKQVHIIEKSPKILPFLSDMYARLAKEQLQKEPQITFHLNTTAGSINIPNKILNLDNGNNLSIDYLIIGIGVKPNTALLPTAAKTANGALIVNEQMQTSLPNIYAAGDCAALKNLITEETGYFPMGTHSNKGGRAAGAQSIGKTTTQLKGAYGTAIVKLFDHTIAKTGLTPQNKDFPYKSNTIISGTTPGFYPNPSDIILTIYYDPTSKVIVGAEGFGKKGVDKRIDVLATAIYAKLTLEDLQNIDFAYAPPFSPAKDPILVASYASTNELDNNFRTITPLDFHQQKDQFENAFLLDVRNPIEIEKNGSILNATNIPLDDLRSRINEIPKNQPIYVYCAKGMRGYLASRILEHHQFSDITNISGGFTLWQMLNLPIEIMETI